jgi:hypothetical protein
VNPWRSPGSILGHHAEDQLAQFLAYAPSAGTVSMSEEPCPIEPKTSSMPTDYSLGLNEDESFLPLRPETTQQDPEDSVDIRESGPRAMSGEN